MTISGVLMGSPLGPLRLVGDGRALTSVEFTESPITEIASTTDDPLLVEARRQLDGYFVGEVREFDLPLAPRGTEFQLRVWEQLRRVPFASTVSYGEIAARMGMAPGASRAVGMANGANPIAIIVPCHRVIGANGKLVGYAAGLPRKRFLLRHESPIAQESLFGS